MSTSSWHTATRPSFAFPLHLPLTVLPPLLIDEGLPDQVARALRELDLDVHAVGDSEAPSKQSSDEVNVAWCKERGAVLVTNDRGKRQRVILQLLAQHHVHAVFIYQDLRAAPPHALARALLVAEQHMHDLATSRRRLIHHRLKPSGRLESR